jgi:putative transposase
MARRPRVFLKGAAHHIVQRGNNRCDIFRSAEDYKLLLQLLSDTSVEFNLQIHAYVLMTNHVHFLATPSRATTIAATMQAIGRVYVPYYNGKYQRTGALFEGRYRSTIVTSETYFMTCMRYIELNPVRAGLCSGPESYRWSSYASHALGRPDGLLTNHELYRRLGEHTPDRCHKWRALCADHVSDPELDRMRRDLKGNGQGWRKGCLVSNPSDNLESRREGGLTP